MERLDKIGFGNLYLIQNPYAFCYGIDAVLLSHFAADDINAQLKSSAKAAIDLGAGTGIIPLILSHKTALRKIYGIELQNSGFKLFERNIEINALNNRLSAINEDVKNLTKRFPELKGQFHCVTANPPYVRRNSGILNSEEEKKIARHETSADIFDFAETAAALLSESGAFYMIHRPNRLSDVFEALLANRLRVEILQAVATDELSPPSMVLLKARKNSRKDLKMLPNLYIYDKDRNYTDKINQIYER